MPWSLSANYGDRVEHARARGLLGFTAEILAANGKTIGLARRACDDVGMRRDGETLEVTVKV